MFGPFVHGLNKGGLGDILANQRLLSTEARVVAGGGVGVRALKGKWENLAERNNWLGRPDPTRVCVEFMTYDSPRNDGHPVEARWDVPEGKYLRVKVLRVIVGDGTVLPQPSPEFGVSAAQVADLLMLSEDVPSFFGNPNDPATPTGHAISQHAYGLEERLKDRAARTGRVVTSFRDFTEMCDAGKTVISSAGGKASAMFVATNGPGSKARLEASISPIEIIMAEPSGAVTHPVVRSAFMLLHGVPSNHPTVIHVQTFYPITSFTQDDKPYFSCTKQTAWS